MWYKAYGWEDNPFSIKPMPILVGLDQLQQEILERTISGSLVLILGDTGVGKTSLLFWLAKELYKYKLRPVYVNLHNVFLPQARALQQHILHQRTPFHRLFRRAPNNIVLLLDEAQELDQAAAQMIKVEFDSKHITSVVLAGCLEPELPGPFKSRVGLNKYCLGKLSPSQAITLIKYRTKNRHPFANDEAIEVLIRYSGGSPRALLQLCEYVCMTFRAKGELGEPITVSDIEDLLSTLPIPGPRNKRVSERAELSEPAAPTLPSLQLETESAKRVGQDGIFSKLSPLQRDIVKLLAEGPKTVAELSKQLGSTQDSIRKRLSQLRTPGEGLAPLVEVISDRIPKTYGLAEWAKERIKTEKL